MKEPSLRILFHLNPSNAKATLAHIILVFIGVLLDEYQCAYTSVIFSGFLLNFVMVKLATSSKRSSVHMV